ERTVPSAADPSNDGLAAVASGDGSKDLVVYSQNVYVGANVDAVLGSAPEDLQANLFTALQTFAATNWPERAATIARFVAEQQPDVIALNEVSTVTVSGLAPYFPDVQVEFLPIFEAALAARGLDYAVAGQVANVDANLSLGGASIRLQDFDVVLTRRGIGVSNLSTGNYAAHVPVVLPAGSIDLVRGWVMADLSEGGRTVRFVTSHLEPQETSLPLQLAQSGELINRLANSPFPVVVAGDLNSDPLDAAPVTSYKQFLAAGFQDAWLARVGNPQATGFTCCQSAPDLRNGSSDLFKRIDLILVRPEGRGGNSTVRPVSMTMVGDELAERTVSGMWPSDHGGVIATLQWKKLVGK
ncbi:MAG: endonuclease/exonuclease/phosphatase family protein, partial [Gemmatimonadales bacterium]